MDSEIILIRHGQTESNRSKRIQGQSDSPLSGLGIQQAVKAGKRLQSLNISQLICSTLGRAVATAELIAAEIKQPFQTDDRLKEIAFGTMEGKTWEEVGALEPSLAEKWRHHHNEVSFSGGESRLEVLDRVKRSLVDHMASNSGQSIAIVTHGGILAALFADILKIPSGQKPMCIIENCSFNIVRVRNQEWKIKTWGDLSHL